MHTSPARASKHASHSYTVQSSELSATPARSAVRLASSLVLTLFVATTAACTAGTTTSGTGFPTEPGPSKDTPSKDAPSTSSTDDDDTKKPAPAEDDDKPQVDKTVHFELTIDGETIVPDEVKVTREVGPGGDPDRFVLKARHEQAIQGPFTSTATSTMV